MINNDLIRKPKTMDNMGLSFIHIGQKGTEAKMSSAWKRREKLKLKKLRLNKVTIANFESLSKQSKQEVKAGGTTLFPRTLLTCVTYCTYEVVCSEETLCTEAPIICPGTIS